MDLRGPRVPQEADDLPGGGAADDGIVDHHHPLARHLAFEGAQFEPYRILPALLVGGDKGPPNVAVLDKTLAVGNTRRLSVAHGSVQAGVRHADDHVGLRRVLPCQDTPGLQPGLMYALTADH